MQEVKNIQFWVTAAEDFCGFRKGKISTQELMQKYPEFDIQEGWLRYSHIKEAIRIVIPADCPIEMIPLMVKGVKAENDDVCRIDYNIRIAYQSAWEAFPQWGTIKQICEDKKPVTFRISLEGQYWRSNKEPVIDIRYCVREGSHGDEDGYGIEDDTWIVGLLNLDGTWFKEWFIED